MFLKNSKNIVIKIGSSLLVDKKQKIRKNWLLSFAKDIKKLMFKDKKVIEEEWAIEKTIKLFK
jgi:glutamate 5-kinase